MVKFGIRVHGCLLALVLRAANRACLGSMSERLPFDLHLAESTAQAAATWFALNALLERQLSTMTAVERASFRATLAAEAVTLVLPESANPDDNAAVDWIARRYWELIDNFIFRAAVADE